MASLLVSLQDIHLTFGGTPLLTGASLSVAGGERICLVGRNGSGKSSLLKIAAGELAADRGEVFRHPGATIRYLPQEPDFGGFQSTLDYVEAGLAPGDDPYRARYLLEALELTGTETPARLSGGEGRRAALARVLAPRPDVLLLDEPTNHLDLPAIEWLERELQQSNTALVLISHDRRFLSTLSRRTIWLSAGRTREFAVPFGAFEAVRDQLIEEELEAAHKLERKLVREEDWLRHGVSGRRKRNQGRLRALHELRRAKHETPAAATFGALSISQSTNSGQLVIEAKDISKSFGTTPVVLDLSVRLMRGDRLGIVGPNGAGKTTLLKMLTGQLSPDSGTVRLGTSLEVEWLDQKRAELAPTTTLSDALTEGRGDTVFVAGRPRHVMSYMKDFLFAPEQARTSVSLLSGGERGRLMLARAFAKPSNLLVLDEPTNDLDLETLDLLEDLIANYEGTVLLVSHDRDFLDRTVTSTLAPTPGKPGSWTEYPGGFSEMERAPAAAAATSPAPGKSPAPAPAASPARPASPRRKLSFKEKHALETLPARLAELAHLISDLRGRLGDPALYARDPRTFAAVTSALTEAEAEHERIEEEWLRLALLQEEIESAT